MGIRAFAVGAVGSLLLLGTMVGCATVSPPPDPRLLVGRWVFNGTTQQPEYNDSLGAGKSVQVTITLDLRDDLTMTLTEVDHGDGVFSPDMEITFTGTWLLDNKLLRQHIKKVERTPPLVALAGPVAIYPFDKLATVEDVNQYFLRLWDNSGEMRDFSRGKTP